MKLAVLQGIPTAVHAYAGCTLGAIAGQTVQHSSRAPARDRGEAMDLHQMMGSLTRTASLLYLAVLVRDEHALPGFLTLLIDAGVLVLAGRLVLVHVCL